ncbi:hypothetical protein R3P38DRAFT_1780003 [Favolaschia claudopus]|uniref:Uncharacterized protein n=1 Tax=Favolaschia claudopus TaxID=2862362 RepID=A0AAW0A6X1_9AGAR
MYAPQASVVVSALCILAILNITTVILGYYRHIETSLNIPTYIDKNYPLELVGWDIEPVEMAFHETVRFDLNASDSAADREWRLLYVPPYTVHLGPGQRLFALAFYHQFHCLRAMQFAITHPEDHTYTLEHIQHCLNYLRQHLLCAADDELEAGDFLRWDLTPGHLESLRVCRDWEKVYHIVDTSLMDFKESTHSPIRT